MAEIAAQEETADSEMTAEKVVSVAATAAIATETMTIAATASAIAQEETIINLSH